MGGHKLRFDFSLYFGGEGSVFETEIQFDLVKKRKLASIINSRAWLEGNKNFTFVYLFL